MNWPQFYDETQQGQRTADVARAMLGFLQLTMENHLEDTDPRMPSGTYLPKYAAQAIWEHAEQGIRLLAPCVGCTMSDSRRLRCPNRSQFCLAAMDNV